MKLSRKWLHEDYLDLSHVSDQELIDRMTAFGHNVKAQYRGDDTVLDFAVPEDRADLACIIGLVREISAAFQMPYRCQQPEVRGTEQHSIFEMLDADIWADHLCNRFSCRIAVNVTVSPSPDWLQRRLLTCGIAPVNCIIDAANYTFLKYGQKITVMDHACITSGSIWIREPMPYETECAFPVLSDGMTPLAYGDAVTSPDAEVTPDTTTLIIIAADYCSSADPMQTVPALQRFCQLIEQLQCGEIADGIIDLLNYVPQQRTLPFDATAINRQLGLNLGAAEMIEYLRSLEIEASEQEISIPSFRKDLVTLADIAKEIRRIHTIHK